jgi:DNA-directed RNA polymerase I subunit RPA49
MSQNEKKRKRPTEENEEGPSKKPATDLSSSNVNLNFVSEPRTLGPVLGEFSACIPVFEDSSNDPIASTPGLVISPDLAFNPYSKSRTKARNRLKPVYSDSELLLHSTTHPTIDYTAREGAAGQDDNLKHYVGIYDHNTAEVSVVEVRSMSVRSSVRQKSPDPQEEAVRLNFSYPSCTRTPG